MLSDYFISPPEVHSTRLTSGANVGSLLSAASAWEGLNVAYLQALEQLYETISQVPSHIWEGESGTAFATSFIPRYAWLEHAATKSRIMASSLEEIAAAFTTAETNMPKMPELIANHVTHAVLVATNFLGINTVPIAVNEADYARMWVQAASTMEGYEGATLPVLASVPPTDTFDPKDALQSLSPKEHIEWYIRWKEAQSVHDKQYFDDKQKDYQGYADSVAHSINGNNQLTGGHSVEEINPANNAAWQAQINNMSPSELKAMAMEIARQTGNPLAPWMIGQTPDSELKALLLHYGGLPQGATLSQGLALAMSNMLSSSAGAMIVTQTVVFDISLLPQFTAINAAVDAAITAAPYVTAIAATSGAAAVGATGFAGLSGLSGLAGLSQLINPPPVAPMEIKPTLPVIAAPSGPSTPVISPIGGETATSAVSHVGSLPSTPPPNHSPTPPPGPGPGGTPVAPQWGASMPISGLMASILASSVYSGAKDDSELKEHTSTNSTQETDAHDDANEYHNNISDAHIPVHIGWMGASHKTDVGGPAGFQLLEDSLYGTHITSPLMPRTWNEKEPLSHIKMKLSDENTAQISDHNNHHATVTFRTHSGINTTPVTPEGNKTHTATQ